MNYQRKIEEVYWRHRIWPKENPGPKSPFDAEMTREDLERKVAGYLRGSEMIGAKRGWSVTPGELQAEMERIARDTKQPGVLRELFQALDNDPFVVAECLTRPILAGRLLTEAPPTQPPFTSGAGFSGYTMPEISGPLVGADDTWTATSNLNPPLARQFHAAVWTGSEMIIWGGFSYSAPSAALDTGARYYPATDSWSATRMVNVPAARDHLGAVWTGREMIVWGGYANGNDLNTGGRYNPAADSWTPTNTATAPLGRESFSTVWTGSKMIVWGGVGCGSNCVLNSGGRYDPTTDTWTPTNAANAPSPRFHHAAVWSGNEMIVWSGTDAVPNTTYLHTGGRYNPLTDSWTPTSLVNLPVARVDSTSIWTGHEMIVWGGVDESFNDTNTGGRYNPAKDSWSATSLGSGAPAARDSHSAVWTGQEMIIWGGNSRSGDLNTDSRYDLLTDSWRVMTTANRPMARSRHTAVWTGNEMIVWGGLSASAAALLDSGGRYSAQPSTPIMTSTVSRKSHAAAGNFDVDLLASGPPGPECRSGGTTGDYTIVVTFLANVSVQGSPQATISSGKGAIGSGGVVDGGGVLISGNVVTIPLTNVANAQTIQITLNNVNGSTNLTIPMRVLVGDVNGNAAVNASDVSLVKASSGQPVDANNFRLDVSADGNINATDISLVKSHSGTGLP